MRSEDRWTAYQDYRTAHFMYQVSISQTQVLTLCTTPLLERFPESLPQEFGDLWLDELRDVVRAVEAGQHLIWAGLRHDEPAQDPLKGPCESDDQRKFRAACRMLISNMASLGLRPPDVDFPRALCCQAIVALFAHIDAFLADSVRTIARVCPQKMKSDKRKISWETVLACGDWEALFGTMVERYTRHLATGSLPQRIARLERTMGLKVDVRPVDLQRLAEAENVRNIIVHNGGRVSQEFIDRVGQTDWPIGSVYPVAPDYVLRVGRSAMLLGAHLDIAVIDKFFPEEASADAHGAEGPTAHGPQPSVNPGAEDIRP